MANNEDAVPEAYPYFWSAGSDISVEEFSAKYKPSMVQNDGAKPWIWVQASQKELPTETINKEAIEEAIKLLNEVRIKIEEITNDSSIPTRGSKKTGTKSKKEVREEVHKKATVSLKDIAARHKSKSGKWLIFAKPENVDVIWSKLASSIASGPLSQTAAYLAKVSTSPPAETPNYQHVICVYMPDVWDKDAVAEVQRMLLRNHGATLAGAKADLYTSIGLDSKHPSGIPSTVWKAKGGEGGLLDDGEIKKLRDAFYAELDGNEDATKQKKAILPKAKPTAAEDDPFASDDEGEADSEPKPELKSAKVTRKAVPAKKKINKRQAEDDEEQDEVEERPKKKTKGKAKAKQKSDDDDFSS